MQKRWARFWAPCFNNWSKVRHSGDAQTMDRNNAASYAPRFHADGHISILQHGSAIYLPCPQEPPRNASKTRADSFALALQLRCRISSVACARRDDGLGCCKPLSRKVVKRQGQLGGQALPAPRSWKDRLQRYGGCFHKGRLRHFDYVCPMRHLSRLDLEESTNDGHRVLRRRMELPVEDAVEHFGNIYPNSKCSAADVQGIFPSPLICDIHVEVAGEGILLPKPGPELRKFLCNDQCPRQCCTLGCPWNCVHECDEQTILEVFSSPCSCKRPSCRICLQETYLQKFEDPLPCSLAMCHQTTLESPPPARHQLYSGIGEPASGSCPRSLEPKLYRLSCHHWSLQDVGGRGPEWLTQGRMLEFLDANGFNTSENYRHGCRGSYSEYMRPILQKYELAPVQCKVYGASSHNCWTQQQAREWIESATPASGSDADAHKQSGWEWMWELDEQTRNHTIVSFA